MDTVPPSQPLAVRLAILLRLLLRPVPASMRTVAEAARQLLHRRSLVPKHVRLVDQAEAAPPSSAPYRRSYTLPTTDESAAALPSFFWCCDARDESALFALLRCNAQPLAMRVTKAMRRSGKDVSYFLNDTASYIASKMWDDLLSSEILSLAPLPYCGSGGGRRQCTPYADADTQFLFAVVLLVVCALIKNRIDSLSGDRKKFYDVVPSMLGMLLGWAFGRGFQMLRDNADGWLKIGPDSPIVARWHCLYAAIVTVMASVFILALEPIAAMEDFGTSSWRRSLGLQVRSLVQLLSKAVATVSMILWNSALSSAVVQSIPADLEYVSSKMLLFYSLSMTFGGSILAVRFVAWRSTIEAARVSQAAELRELLSRKREIAIAQRDEEHRAASFGGAHATEGSAGGTSEPSSARGGDGSPSLLRRSRALTDVLNFNGALGSIASSFARLRIQSYMASISLRILAIVEGTLGWVAGCAWTDFVVSVNPSLALFPTPRIFLMDIAVAFWTTALAIAFLTATGGTAVIDGEKATDRNTRERFFIAYAFSFFSGWSWVSVVRDIWALPSWLIHRSETTSAFRRSGEVALALGFTILATWGVLSTTLATKEWYERHARRWKKNARAIVALARSSAYARQPARSRDMPVNR